MVTVQVALDDRTAEELEQAARAQSTEPSALAEQAIRAFLHGEAQRAMEREAAAFKQLHPDLAASIPGEYAAIHQGKLVDHDADQLALLARRKRLSGADGVDPPGTP